jgi:hypothetical protein
MVIDDAQFEKLKTSLDGISTEIAGEEGALASVATDIAALKAQAASGNNVTPTDIQAVLDTANGLIDPAARGRADRPDGDRAGPAPDPAARATEPPPAEATA